ncbi:MAG: class I SAM-dependent methyltransferase [Bifidobacteriaceae bacterium]|nr:class I SAM-dependent methyltransferase [Bifidobacteriaceae bacterium]
MTHTPEAHLAHAAENARWTGERCDAVAAVVRLRLPSGLMGMDYGCGSGHVGLRIADHFASMDLVDISAEVIASLADEVAGRPSLRAYTLDLTRDEPPRQVDCVIASMSFHHVSDTDRLLDGLARTVRSGGCLMVVDMDADNGEFHAAKHDFDGHDGFDRSALAHRIAAHGFDVTEVCDVWSGQRWSADTLVEYSAFMIMARRLENTGEGISEMASCVGLAEPIMMEQQPRHSTTSNDVYRDGTADPRGAVCAPGTAPLAYHSRW